MSLHDFRYDPKLAPRDDDKLQWRCRTCGETTLLHKSRDPDKFGCLGDGSEEPPKYTG